MSLSPLTLSPLIKPTSQDSKLPLTTGFFFLFVHAVQVCDPAPTRVEPASTPEAHRTIKTTPRNLMPPHLFSTPRLNFSLTKIPPVLAIARLRRKEDVV